MARSNDITMLIFYRCRVDEITPRTVPLEFSKYRIKLKLRNQSEWNINSNRVRFFKIIFRGIVDKYC